jgi:hypothetical protein
LPLIFTTHFISKKFTYKNTVLKDGGRAVKTLRQEIVCKENTNVNTENKSATVISLSQVKDERNKEKEQNSFQRYLKVLSFSELIDETTILIKEINQVGSTREVIARAKALLKELGNRFEKSQGLSESFHVMRKKLEGKINELY